LFAQGVIPIADYIKVDVEGFEHEVLLGAHELLAAGVLGLHAETSFGISPSYPKGHFVAVAEIAFQNHLLVFDLAFNRIPCASFQRALVERGFEPIAEEDAVGRPCTIDVLFARDLINEIEHLDHYCSPTRPVSIDQLIKTMIIFELHQLNDVALEMAERFSERLGTHLDVNRAVYLLADPKCVVNEYCRQQRAHKRAYEKTIAAYELSTSWRITAPLRWVRQFFDPPRRQFRTK
jgi:hypothetical protein